MTLYDDRREVALITLEEMEAMAHDEGDYELQAHLRTMIQILKSLRSIKKKVLVTNAGLILTSLGARATHPLL